MTTHRFLFGLARYGETVDLGAGMAFSFKPSMTGLDLTNSRARCAYRSRIEVSPAGDRAAIFMSPADTLPEWEHVCAFDGHCACHTDGVCCYCEEG